MAVGQIVTVVLLVLVAVAVLALKARAIGYVWGGLWELVTYDLRSSDPTLRRRARIALRICLAVAAIAPIVVACYLSRPLS